MLALHTLWHVPFPLTRALFSPSVKIYINYAQICVKDSREKQMHAMPFEMIYRGSNEYIYLNMFYLP